MIVLISNVSMSFVPAVVHSHFALIGNLYRFARALDVVWIAKKGAGGLRPVGEVQMASTIRMQHVGCIAV